MMRRLMFATVFLTASAAPSVSQVWAGILVDYSPGATGADLGPDLNSNWQNRSDMQNFAMMVSFAAGATVTGMDIYGPSLSSGRDQAVVRLWDVVSGNPGTLISETTESIATVDAIGVGNNPGAWRIHVDFANPLTLAAGASYFIGMSGPTYSIGAFTLEGPNAPSDLWTAMFNGKNLAYVENHFPIAFRLEGTLGGTAVPEPASWLMGATAGVLGLALARRRRAA